jgi:hypothetical protein
MSRKTRSKRQLCRPAGVIASPESQRVIDLASNFDAQLGDAARQTAVESRVPYGHVQTIVPGANYHGKANTAAAQARLHAMKLGVDPALNRKFETATEAREYRRREGIEVMSPREFEAETSNMGSSRRRNAWIDTPVDGNRDPETGKPVPAFKGAEAFQRGAEVAREMFNYGHSI